MADIIPPAPVNDPPNSYGWVDWYVKLVAFVNSQTNILWANINKSGANLTDIPTRLHNDLQTVQGGGASERYHLTSAQHTEATNVRSSRGVDTTDDVIIDLATKGLVLKDTQATPHYWRVTISTTGVLTTTDLGTTKP